MASHDTSGRWGTLSIPIPTNAESVIFDVADGANVKEGQRLGSYSFTLAKSTVKRIEAIAAPVCGIFELVGSRLRFCRHPVLHGSSCVYCGADTLRLPHASRQLFEQHASATRHAESGTPGPLGRDGATGNGMQVIGGSHGFSLQVSSQHAAHLDGDRAARLVSLRRLVLVLDLDHTLLHATSHAEAGAGEQKSCES